MILDIFVEFCLGAEPSTRTLVQVYYFESSSRNQE